MTLIDGKAVAARCKDEIRARVAELKARGITPGLAVILVGDNPASQVYVRNKERDCAECGIYSEEYRLPGEIGQRELLDLIEVLNGNPAIHGILVQLPLPGHLSEKLVIDSIAPEKDVDAFHPYNVGRIMQGDFRFVPCTPAGVMRLLDEYGVDPAGKHCVVIGRSNIVGKPMAMLLLHRNGTVTICHSKTPDLREQCLQADILVSAAGRRGLVTADMVKPGAVVIDVAMNRNDQGKLCGDVDFAAAKEIASMITPVPGGVGPMTRVELLENTLMAALAAAERMDAE